MNNSQPDNERPPGKDFLTPAFEEPENKNEGQDTDALYLNNSSLETEAEFKQDKKSNHTQEDQKVTTSGIDDLLSNSDGAAGTDRAGTAERKKYGDPELNKGLEAQAMDEES